MDNTQENQNFASIIESMLFVSGEPMKISKIAKLCNVSSENIISGIEILKESYSRENRGLFIIQKNNEVQLATSPKNAEYISRLVNKELKNDLSQPALEVLAIIAYRGPITRVQIEAIRGVNCSYILRNLMIKGLIERNDQADTRGYLYAIAFDFLKNLGISKIEEIPEWKNLSKNEKIETLLEENAAENIGLISQNFEKD